MTDAEQAPKDLIGFLDFYLVKKAPFQIPEGGREFIVQWGPWISIVLLVLSLPVILFALGIGTFLVPFAGLGYASGFGLAVVTLIIHFGLWIAALPGLFARKMGGWRLLFYGELFSIATSLLQGAIVGAIIGGLIGLYILFQVRTKYS